MLAGTNQGNREMVMLPVRIDDADRPIEALK